MAVQINVVRRGGVLLPAGDDDREALRHVTAGDVWAFTLRKRRNYRLHRKFFALANVVAEHSSVFDTTAKAVTAIKLAAGHCDFAPHPLTGELQAVPKSIAFDAMDDAAFSAFYETAVQAVLAHLLPAMDRVSLDEAVDQLAGF